MTLDLDAFGTMIRTARERRGLRAIDLAVAMRWAGTAPVYRYERGGPDAPRPDPDTINQLAQVLGLGYPDRMTLLGLAGHLPDTIPLSADEERQLVDGLASAMDRLPGPALVFDYRGRIIGLNTALAEAVPALPGRLPDVTLIDLVWDPALGVAGRVLDPVALRRFQLIRFQAFNAMRRHEAWYRAVPDRYGHYPGFRETWSAIERELVGSRAPDGAGADRTDTLPAAHVPVGIRLPDDRVVSFDISQVAAHGGGGLVAMLVMSPVRPDGKPASSWRPGA